MRDSMAASGVLGAMIFISLVGATAAADPPLGERMAYELRSRQATERAALARADAALAKIGMATAEASYRVSRRLLPKGAASLFDVSNALIAWRQMQFREIVSTLASESQMLEARIWTLRAEGLERGDPRHGTAEIRSAFGGLRSRVQRATAEMVAGAGDVLRELRYQAEANTRVAAAGALAPEYAEASRKIVGHAEELLGIARQAAREATESLERIERDSRL